MMTEARILAFAGSAREGSWNRKLIRIAADAARNAGAAVTLIEMRDYELPIYDGDLEANDGLPENAIRLKTLFKDHDALLLSCPEYNSSITPLLKNVIDWVSRPHEGERPLECFDGKVAALLSASPGALGGLRGLVTVRSILGNIKVIVLPEQKAISKANEAFNDDGSLKDEKDREAVERIARTLVEVAGRLSQEVASASRT